jgi:Putative Ig domain
MKARWPLGALAAALLSMVVVACQDAESVRPAARVCRPSWVYIRSITGLPAGAVFDRSTGTFRWRPEAAQVGSYDVTLVADDGVLPVKKPLTITVTPRAVSAHS